MTKFHRPLLGRFWFDNEAASNIFDGVMHILKHLFGERVFASDNLIAFHKSTEFLDDGPFVEAFQNNIDENLNFTIVWRTHIVCWAARSCLSLPGAFVECGTYKGTTAGVINEYVLGGEDKPFYLYDLFEYVDEPGVGHELAGLEKGLLEEVTAKFSGHENIHIVPGKVPESLTANHPDRVAFLHIDMNNAVAELAALSFFWDKMSPGGIIIFDDYGWTFYQDQKRAIDGFFAGTDVFVVELPTGQGMAIKR